MGFGFGRRGGCSDGCCNDDFGGGCEWIFCIIIILVLLCCICG